MARSRQRGRSITVAATAALMITAACSSSSNSGSSGGPGTGASAGKTTGSKLTITVGVVTDLTGQAASGNKTFVNGVKAGTFYAAREGYTVKYVVADTQTSPTAALSAAKQLVTQNHVNVVLMESALGFSAAPYFTAQKVPVIGVSQDGPEWITSKNMFALSGVLRQDKVATTAADFFKCRGPPRSGPWATASRRPRPSSRKARPSPRNRWDSRRATSTPSSPSAAPTSSPSRWP